MVIGLVGYIGAGKNTVADIIIEEYGYKHESFATSLKDVCAIVFGWDRILMDGNTEESRVWRSQVDEWWGTKLGIPNFTPRLALQLIGTDVFRDNFHKNIWTLSLERRITGDNIVISDTRFPNEIDIVRKHHGVIIKIDNGISPPWKNVAENAYHGDAKAKNIMLTTYGDVHFSEWSWAGVQPDYIIDNVGTLSDLRENTREVLNSIV